jgi:hypothetical protein
MKIQGYIYKLTLNKNLESFKKEEIYVGKHNGRKELYFSGGKIVNRILKKYGREIFKKEILSKDIDSNELLNYLEKYYIQYYKCNKNKYNKGLNLTDGGEGIFGFKKSKEQCEALSKRIKEEYKKGLRKSPKGKDVHQYNKQTGKYLKTFKNCTEAALFINQPAKSNTSIAQAARDVIKSAYGFMWSYRKMNIIDKIAGFNNPILQYDLKGNFIKEYQNASIAATKNNFKSFSSLHNCANGKSKTSYGFIWKFKNK